MEDEYTGVVYKADVWHVSCGVAEYLKRNNLEGHGLSTDQSEALNLLGRMHLPHGAWEEQREYEWDTDNFPKLLPYWHEPETCGGCGGPIYMKGGVSNGND